MKPEFTKKPEFMLLAAQQKRNSPSLIGELLRFFLVFLAGTVATSILTTVPMTIWMLSGSRMEQMMGAMMESGGYDTVLDNLLAVMGNLMSSMPMWLTALIIVSNFVFAVLSALYCKIFEKRNLASMGLGKGRAVGSYLLGGLIGAASFAAVAGLACLFNGVGFEGVNPIAQIWPTLLVMLFAYVLQSAGEELLVRGYLMVSLSKRFRLPVCIGVSSVIFGALHVANIGINFLAFLNIALVGVVLALYILLTGDLWGACGYHAMWNFFQGNVFGLPVSGISSSDSLFAMRIISQNELLTGGEFGLEGSLCTTFVLLASLGILIFLLLRRPPDPVTEEPA